MVFYSIYFLTIITEKFEKFPNLIFSYLILDKFWAVSDSIYLFEILILKSQIDISNLKQLYITI